MPDPAEVPPPLPGMSCAHCVPGPRNEPISTDPAHRCSHVARGHYGPPTADYEVQGADPLPTYITREELDVRIGAMREQIGVARALAEQRDPAPTPTPFGAPMRIGEPCWWRSSATMPWMPGVFEGVDDETGDALVLALESNLETRRWRFEPRIRPLNAAAAPPLVRQDEAERRLVDQRLRFEALVVATKALLCNAERKGERFTTARTPDVQALREALAGLGSTDG